jgi:RNA polymerase sigma-54 factor
VKGIKQDSGIISTLSVMQKIRELVENEDAGKPLNDFKLQAALKEQGINIARRTVAKYRDSLKLSAANMRKK